MNELIRMGRSESGFLQQRQLALHIRLVADDDGATYFQRAPP